MTIPLVRAALPAVNNSSFEQVKTAVPASLNGRWVSLGSEKLSAVAESVETAIQSTLPNELVKLIAEHVEPLENYIASVEFNLKLLDSAQQYCEFRDFLLANTCPFALVNFSPRVLIAFLAKIFQRQKLECAHELNESNWENRSIKDLKDQELFSKICLAFQMSPEKLNDCTGTELICFLCYCFANNKYELVLPIETAILRNDTSVASVADSATAVVVCSPFAKKLRECTASDFLDALHWSGHESFRASIRGSLYFLESEFQLFQKWTGPELVSLYQDNPGDHENAKARKYDDDKDYQKLLRKVVLELLKNEAKKLQECVQNQLEEILQLCQDMAKLRMQYNDDSSQGACFYQDFVDFCTAIRPYIIVVFPWKESFEHLVNKNLLPSDAIVIERFTKRNQVDFTKVRELVVTKVELPRIEFNVQNEPSFITQIFSLGRLAGRVVSGLRNFFGW